MNAVVGEDLPRSFTRLLAQKGFTVFDVRKERNTVYGRLGVLHDVFRGRQNA